VSATLRNRSGQADRRDLVRPIQRTIAELQADGELPQVTKPGAALTRRADLVPTEDRVHRGERPGPGAEPDGGTE
jgi:NADH-quinone oxidoreductase subunit J